MEANVSTYKTHFFLSSINLPLPDVYKIPLNIENVAPAKKKNTGSNCNNKSYNFISNIVWICENCGHTHIGGISPDTCPICGKKMVSAK